MVFDVYGNDRLTDWKQFRDTLETSPHPLDDVAELWSHAPFVSDYLDPQTPTEWPDPWHLILDLRLDDLAIALGMLYTIKLTHRFIDTPCEIHKFIFPKKVESQYLLLVDKKYVLNLEYNAVVGVERMSELETKLIWSVLKL
jgi:hypothetical protein